MGQGFALSGAAGAGADMLQEILKQKFLEDLQRKRLAEDARQADMSNALGHRNAGVAEGHLGVRRDEHGLSVDQFAEGNRRYAGEEPIRAANLRLHTAQAAKYEREPQDAADAFARTMQVEGLRAGNELQQIQARGKEDQKTASIRAANSGAIPFRVNTVDEQGNPVTRVMSRADAISGGEFAAAPTTDQRNRQAASGRAASVLSAVSDLSERINTGQGIAAKAQGEIAKAQAAANLNDDVSEYEAVVSGFTPLLARAVGHSGVLTEQDVQSVRKMLPQPGDSKSVRDRKVARINSLMGDLGGSEQTPVAGGAAADLVWDGQRFVKPGGK